MEKAYRALVMDQLTEAVKDADWHGVSIIVSSLLGKIDDLRERNERLEEVVRSYEQAEVAKW